MQRIAFRLMLDLMAWAIEFRNSNPQAARLFQEHALLTAKSNGWDDMPLLQDFAKLEL